jgi:hypothetical protein
VTAEEWAEVCRMANFEPKGVHPKLVRPKNQKR